MADPTKTVAGMYGALYTIEETEPNATPDGADWNIRVAPLKGFSPTFNPNIQPLTSAGSKRMVGHTQGAAYDIGAGFNTELWGDIWLEYLKMAFGNDTGTGDPCSSFDRLPTYSLIGLICRERGVPSEYEKAVLFNGWKATTMSMVKTIGPAPVSMAFSGRAQYAQIDDGTFPSDKPQFIGFQGTGGSPLGVNSFSSMPAPELPPVKYYHWQEKIKYVGGALVDLPRIQGWTLSTNQALVPIPGRVVGDDTDVWPLWKGFAEEAMEVALNITVMPENLAYYEQVVYALEVIEYIDLIYTAPPGYSIPSKTIRLHNGMWETGDWGIAEQTAMTQTLPAKFESVEII